MVIRVVGVCCLTRTMSECTRDSELMRRMCVMVAHTTVTYREWSTRVSGVMEGDGAEVFYLIVMVLLCMMANG